MPCNLISNESEPKKKKKLNEKNTEMNERNYSDGVVHNSIRNETKLKNSSKNIFRTHLVRISLPLIYTASFDSRMTTTVSFSEVKTKWMFNANNVRFLVFYSSSRVYWANNKPSEDSLIIIFNSNCTPILKKNIYLKSNATKRWFRISRNQTKTNKSEPNRQFCRHRIATTTK